MSGETRAPGPATPRWESLARAAAQTRSGADEGTEAVLELLAFGVGAESYAVPIERVREIVRMRPITAVPRVPPSLCGVVSLRGEIVQVVDLRRRLGLPAAEPTRDSRIVVLHAEDGRVAGLLVDAVTQVLRVEEATLRSPAGGESEWVEALCPHDGGFVSLVKLERVLNLDADA